MNRSNHFRLAKEIGVDAAIFSEEKDFADALGTVDSSIVFASSDEYVSLTFKITKKG